MSEKDDVSLTTTKQRQLRPDRDPISNTIIQEYDPNDTKFLHVLQDLASDRYTPNPYEGKTEFYATVLKNLHQDKPASSLTDFKVRVVARVDKIHAHLPLPADPEDCSVISLYPEFVAESLEQIGGTQPEVGQLLRINFKDRHQTGLKYANGQVLEVLNQLGTQNAAFITSPLRKFVSCNGPRPKPRVKPPQGGRVEPPPGGAAPPAQPPTEPATGPRANPPCTQQLLIRELEDLMADVTPGDTSAIEQQITWDPNTVKEIARLHPAIRDKCVKFLKYLFDKEKVKMTITAGRGFRTAQEQQAIRENNPTSTFAGAGQSWHNYGLAFDIVEAADSKNGYGFAKDYPKDLWHTWGRIGKSFGFQWGGEFRVKDPNTGRLKDFFDGPHFQMKFGLTPAQAIRKVRDGDVDKDGYIKVIKK